jgi:hypothetical protein
MATNHKGKHYREELGQPSQNKRVRSESIPFDFEQYNSESVFSYIEEIVAYGHLSSFYSFTCVSNLIDWFELCSNAEALNIKIKGLLSGLEKCNDCLDSEHIQSWRRSMFFFLFPSYEPSN